jgi:phosphoglycerate dehydrogenase-like enzyme
MRSFHLHVHTDAASSIKASFTREAFAAKAVAFPGLTDGLQVTFGSTPAEFEDALPNAEAVLLTGIADLHNLRRRAPNLRWLHCTSAGVEWLLRSGLPPDLLMTNAAGTHEPKAAEFALLSVLMLNNHIPALVVQQQQKTWRPLPASTVAGRTVLVLGMGALGGASAALLRRQGLHVIGVNRTGEPHPDADETHRQDDLHALLPRTDFLLICLPLTSQTAGLIGRKALDLLPRHAGVINIGRGPVMDYDALAEKLRAGELAGAVLDVFPEEPLQADSPFWSIPNAIVTPHCGLYDPQNYGPRGLEIFFRHLERYRSGASFTQSVDFSHGY